MPIERYKKGGDNVKEIMKKLLTNKKSRSKSMLTVVAVVSTGVLFSPWT